MAGLYDPALAKIRPDTENIIKRHIQLVQCREAGFWYKGKSYYLPEAYPNPLGQRIQLHPALREAMDNIHVEHKRLQDEAIKIRDLINHVLHDTIARDDLFVIFPECLHHHMRILQVPEITYDSTLPAEYIVYFQEQFKPHLTLIQERMVLNLLLA